METVFSITALVLLSLGCFAGAFALIVSHLKYEFHRLIPVSNFMEGGFLVGYMASWAIFIGVVLLSIPFLKGFL